MKERVKAGEAEHALTLYAEIAERHVGDLDFNDFPLDLLARFQSAVALNSLGRSGEAAEQLAHLIEVLLDRLWTFGGYGELALARQAIDLLGNEGLLRRLSPSQQPDLAAIRRRLNQNAARQADQALLLALVPAITAEATPLEPRASRFQLDDAQAGSRTLLLAHRWFDRGDRRRRLVVQLDDRALRRQIEAALATAARANPEFHTALHPSDPELLQGMGRGIRVVRPLDPWLPSYSLVITSTNSFFCSVDPSPS